MFGSKFKYLVMLSAITFASNAQAAVDDKLDNALVVELVGGAQTDKEDVAVVAALQKLLQAIAHRNVDQVGALLSDDVTTFDSKTKRYVYGKQSVLQHLKANVLGGESAHPVKRMTVYNPFVHIKGETAMVSFRATKDLNDANGTTLESWCSEVYERKDGQWLVLHLKTDWKPIKKSAKYSKQSAK